MGSEEGKEGVDRVGGSAGGGCGGGQRVLSLLRDGDAVVEKAEDMRALEGVEVVQDEWFVIEGAGWWGVGVVCVETQEADIL